ncbi:hypothetical protein [Jeongeupia sp. USM3]|uniref:hypothetical protein n=1 Tax=Jeongeupia sp. USM3 TaxID=1906741 RepID=UPI0011AB5ADB|nr:hypothetical protein [Jeongeupia sp. USM3]
MRWLIAFAVCAVAIFIAVWFSPMNPWQEPPGEGEASLKAFKNLPVLIQALEKFHADNGSYPTDLEALIPRYLAKLPDISSEKHNTSLKYFSKGKVYELSFKYYRPGINSCTYTFPQGWGCMGYF